MADPSLQLSFQAMQVRVADYLGIADRSGSSLAVPTDAKNLELVKRFVNDGYRRFVTDNEKWNFLNVPLSFTFYAQQSLTITSRTATTLVVSSLATTYADDYFNGFEVTATDATTGAAFVYTVTDYTGLTGTFTFAATSALLGSGDNLKVAGPRNVAGLAYRYYMPDDFYGIWKQELTFDENGPRVRIVAVSEEELREFRAGSRTTGTSVYVAFRAINTDATATGKRWEALFWPEPSQSLVVSGIYKRFPAALSATTDVSVAGFHHDNAVLAASLAAAELYRNDKVGVHEQTYLGRLETSKKLDARSNSKVAKPYGDGSNGSGFTRPSSDVRPASYNGISLTDP